jgi:hypothetical protein
MKSLRRGSGEARAVYKRKVNERKVNAVSTPMKPIAK